VREGDFYYLGASEKFCYSMFIFRNLNDKLISITVPSLHTGNEPNFSKLFPEFSTINCRSAPRFLCLQNAVQMPRNTCQLLQQIFGCINGCTVALKTVPNFPEKPHNNLSLFHCQERIVRTCTESVRYGLSTTVCPSSKSVPKYDCTD
jgi:hypothetical protein